MTARGASDFAPAGTCRFCGCTESTPCDGGCVWADAMHTLCNRCHLGYQAGEFYVVTFATVTGDLAGLDVANRGGGSFMKTLPADEQQAHVLAARAVLEALLPSATQANGEIQNLANFLKEHHGAAVDALVAAEPQLTPIDVAMRLLGERRVVLATTLPKALDDPRRRLIIP